MKSSRFDTIPERRLIVHVPQLEPLLRQARRRPPLIAALTRREPQPLDGSAAQTVVAVDQPVAAAALTRRVDRPDDADGIWLRADPVGLQPDLAAVWLQTGSVFESGDWSAELAERLGEEGLTLELIAGSRGYIRLTTTPQVRFAPPWTLAGNSLEHCLPEGPDARHWRRLLNDTQVILRQHRQRAANPEAVPGSLWFWGAGRLPAAGTLRPRMVRIVADDPILVGLADWLNLPRRAFSDQIAARPGDLIEWPARFSEDAETNLERLAAFLRPAWRRLRLGRLGVLELAGRQTRRRFSPVDAWRVWR